MRTVGDTFLIGLTGILTLLFCYSCSEPTASQRMLSSSQKSESQLGNNNNAERSEVERVEEEADDDFEVAAAIPIALTGAETLLAEVRHGLDTTALGSDEFADYQELGRLNNGPLSDNRDKFERGLLELGPHLGGRTEPLLALVQLALTNLQDAVGTQDLTKGGNLEPFTIQNPESASEALVVTFVVDPSDDYPWQFQIRHTDDRSYGDVALKIGENDPSQAVEIRVTKVHPTRSGDAGKLEVKLNVADQQVRTIRSLEKAPQDAPQSWETLAGLRSLDGIVGEADSGSPVFSLAGACWWDRVPSPGVSDADPEMYSPEQGYDKFHTATIFKPRSHRGRVEAEGLNLRMLYWKDPGESQVAATSYLPSLADKSCMLGQTTTQDSAETERCRRLRSALEQPLEAAGLDIIR